MKLKMKFYETIIELVEKNLLFITASKKCEKIADSYCIDFAYWITDSRNEHVKGSIEIEELLKIYKKENKL